MWTIATTPPSLPSTPRVTSPLAETAIRETLRPLSRILTRVTDTCSVRITSNKNYTGGLFILDAAAMPTGCGTWPSFWVRSLPMDSMNLANSLCIC